MLEEVMTDMRYVISNSRCGNSRFLPAHHQLLPVVFQREQMGIFESTGLCLFVTRDKPQKLKGFFGQYNGLEKVACFMPKGGKAK